MRKKLIIFISVISIIILTIFFKFAFLNYKRNNSKSESAAHCDLSFAVLSDIHDNKYKLKNAIDDLYNINSNMDAIVLNGDSVDQGLDEQYEDIKNILDKESNKLPNIIIKNIGNHEYYDYSYKVSTDEDVQNLINKYLNFSGTSKIYHDTWIKGYHFISLGSDDTGVDKVNYTDAFISYEQILWLKETIAENYEKGRPIFIFLHQPIDTDSIKNILLQYPETILFNSHTHFIPDKNIDKSQQIITVNTGSVNSNYILHNGEKEFKEDDSYSNGIYVEVTGNRLIIKARNFKDYSWIYSRKLSL